MTMETNIMAPRASYVDWGVIFAGAAVACAITTILVQFGTAVGMTQVTNELSVDANVTPGLVLGAGIWLLWVQVLSTLAGGYLAGRMRAPIAGASEHERDMRDGVHGLLVWAVSTLAVLTAISIFSAVAALADNPTEDVIQAADLRSIEEKMTIIFAFCAAATSLVCGVISWWVATVGGDHRDSGADHSRYFSFRAKR